MATVEISIGRLKYQIDCPEDEHEKLIHLAHKLDERVKKSLNNLRNVDEKTLLIITALTLEDELESKSYNEDENSMVKIDENDLYEVLTENIKNTTLYIEKLAKKIENY